MKQALFESLTGRFLDGTPVDSVAPHHRQIKSIQDHLDRLFNTRQGSITHLPDYGLPDITEIYRKMPDGVQQLRDAVKKTVEKYEPRLRRVKVAQRQTEAISFKLEFILSGELSGGRLVRFQTTFTTMGNSTIAPWKKVD